MAEKKFGAGGEEIDSLCGKKKCSAWVSCTVESYKQAGEHGVTASRIEFRGELSRRVLRYFVTET